MTTEGSERWNVAGFEVGQRGPQASELRQLLEDGKSKETDPLLEPPERNATLDFSPVRLLTYRTVG